MKSTRTRVLLIGGAVLLAVVAALAQGMHHHGGGFDHMLGYYSDALDLTSAQQDQIKAIWAKEKPAMQPLHQQMKDFHTQMNQLTESGTFDEGKVRALATQQAQARIEMEVQHARIKSEMFQVLTADQKTKMQQLEAKHAERMQRHMGHMGQAPSEPPSD